MKNAFLYLCLSFPLVACDPAAGPDTKCAHYDVAKEVTIQGTVTAVSTRAAGPGKMVAITIQAAGKTTEVMVAPDFVLASKHFTFAVGDKVAAICAPMGADYTARQITRGSDTLAILDKTGKPVDKPKPYDLSKETTLKGKVTAVNAKNRCAGKMISLSLQTADKAAEVELTLEAVLTSKHFSVAAGDEVTILCSPTPMGTYKARQITLGDKSLAILGKDGTPLDRPAKSAPEGAPRM